ncbi:Tim44-like domain-containing protein [Thiomicrorhabdus sp.]|uniref:Tim44 domain-containing protein n=1 Tax=Thiomicrorhabdus sp. TaxID=2039724 RepID=UPI0029C7700E|nr:Tim44-like domain-containing protein [Thiomicrorhabdus sp.]
MKKILAPGFTLLLSVFFVLFSLSQTAQAKRLGGGSFGYTKPVTQKTQPAPTQKQTVDSSKTTASTATTTKTSGASRWLGPLAGLAAGGLLAAMLFGDGFEGLQFLDILLFALIAFMLFKLFASRKSQSESLVTEAYRRPQQPVSSQPVNEYFRDSTPAYNPHAERSIIGSGLGEMPSQDAVSIERIPGWFDEHAFLQGSKQHFAVLQHAWDEGDLSLLRDYCTDELYAELQAELTRSGVNEFATKIDTLHAEIIETAQDGDYFIVSVRFNGFIAEDGGEAHAFNDVWHIRRLVEGEGNWQLAGIQPGH